MQWIILLVLLCAIGLVALWEGGAFAALLRKPGMQVHFLSVGKGDCILILADGQSVLIDAGYQEGADYIVEYLKRQGVSRLDAVIATHPHKDHIGSMAAVIRAFDPRSFYLSPRAHTSGEYRTMMQALDEKEISGIVPVPGEVLTLGKAVFQFYAPAHDGYEEINDASVVVLLEYESARFLLAGDIEQQGEQDLLATGYDLSADVLKVAHHGDNSSTKADLLGRVQPEYAVITCASENDISNKVLKRLDQAGVQVLTTADDEVIFEVTGQTLHLRQP